MEPLSAVKVRVSAARVRWFSLLIAPLLLVAALVTGAPGAAHASSPAQPESVSPVGARSMVAQPLVAPASDKTASLGAPNPQDTPGPSPAHLVHGLNPHTSNNTSNVYVSDNWAGEFDTGTTYTEVSGSWVVPSVTPATSAQYSASWIGIDGATNTSLIQTGTSQDTPDGATPYYAWIEILPAASIPINATVEPLDHMEALIEETSPGTWTIEIEDVTQAWIYSGSFAYSGPADSAEWIEEAPTVNGSQSALADFGSVQFSDLGLAGSDTNATTLSPIYMLNAEGAVTAFPGTYDSATNSFPVDYGSPPPPTVTGISPPQGATSGGTTVTIYGSSLSFGPLAVYFGGVLAAFSATDAANGEITATAPPGNVGTVAVTVETMGGTSATSTSDQFTYQAPTPIPTPTPTPTPTTTATAPHGYSLVGSDGGIFTFGSAQFHGSTGSLHLQRPVVGIVPTTDRGGYWLDASDGGIFAFGDAGFYGSIPGLGLSPAGSGRPKALNAAIVGMVPSADGGGYFMVASDGVVFAFGDAHFAGSCPGIGGCSGAAVAVMPDASGNGYWLVTQTGHVYTFGDAPYFGAPGSVSVAVTSAVRTPDGRGYWILYANGAIANFGDAGEFGTPVGTMGGSNPATAIFSTSDGGGYWVTAANGAVANYGDAPNDGSMLGTELNGSIIAATGW